MSQRVTPARGRAPNVRPGKEAILKQQDEYMTTVFHEWRELASEHTSSNEHSKPELLRKLCDATHSWLVSSDWSSDLTNGFRKLLQFYIARDMRTLFMEWKQRSSAQTAVAKLTYQIFRWPTVRDAQSAWTREEKQTRSDFAQELLRSLHILRACFGFAMAMAFVFGQKRISKQYSRAKQGQDSQSDAHLNWKELSKSERSSFGEWIANAWSIFWSRHTLSKRPRTSDWKLSVGTIQTHMLDDLLHWRGLFEDEGDEDQENEKDEKEHAEEQKDDDKGKQDENDGNDDDDASVWDGIEHITRSEHAIWTVLWSHMSMPFIEVAWKWTLQLGDTTVPARRQKSWKREFRHAWKAPLSYVSPPPDRQSATNAAAACAATLGPSEPLNFESKGEGDDQKQRQKRNVPVEEEKRVADDDLWGEPVKRSGLEKAHALFTMAEDKWIRHASPAFEQAQWLTNLGHLSSAIWVVPLKINADAPSHVFSEKERTDVTNTRCGILWPLVTIPNASDDNKSSNDHNVRLLAYKIVRWFQKLANQHVTCDLLEYAYVSQARNATWFKTVAQRNWVDVPILSDEYSKHPCLLLVVDAMQGVLTGTSTDGWLRNYPQDMPLHPDTWRSLFDLLRTCWNNGILLPGTTSDMLNVFRLRIPTDTRGPIAYALPHPSLLPQSLTTTKTHLSPLWQHQGVFPSASTIEPVSFGDRVAGLARFIHLLWRMRLADTRERMIPFQRLVLQHALQACADAPDRPRSAAAPGDTTWWLDMVQARPPDTPVGIPAQKRDLAWLHMQFLTERSFVALRSLRHHTADRKPRQCDRLPSPNIDNWHDDFYVPGWERLYQQWLKRASRTGERSLSTPVPSLLAEQTTEYRSLDGPTPVIGGGSRTNQHEPSTSMTRGTLSRKQQQQPPAVFAPPPVVAARVGTSGGATIAGLPRRAM